MIEIPMRCESCNNIVGYATASDDFKIEEAGRDENNIHVSMTSVVLDAQIDPEKHAEDCPLREILVTVSCEFKEEDDPSLSFKNIFDQREE